MTDPVKDGGFPHLEISGSKVANHLPEAYRRYAASFIALFSLGIHHTPLLRTPARNSENRVFSCPVRCVSYLTGVLSFVFFFANMPCDMLDSCIPIRKDLPC